MNINRMNRTDKITRTRQRQRTKLVRVPCAATEMTRAKNARGKVQQKMKGFVNRIGGRSETPSIKDRLTDERYQDYLARRMKEICDKLYDKFGTTTNKEEENMYAIGKTLIDEALKSNEKRRKKF